MAVSIEETKSVPPLLSVYVVVPTALVALNVQVLFKASVYIYPVVTWLSELPVTELLLYSTPSGFLNLNVNAFPLTGPAIVLSPLFI